MPLSVVLLGPPGSGKGTQAELLCQQFGFAHVNSGALLRAQAAADTALGRRAVTYMRRGDPVPDTLVTDLVLVAAAQQAHNGLVIDGFPKTIGQAETLNTALVAANCPVKLAISLRVDLVTLGRRLLDRGRQQHRDDDRPKIIERRLDSFGRTAPDLHGYYRRLGILAIVDADRPPPTVASDIAGQVIALIAGKDGCCS